MDSDLLSSHEDAPNVAHKVEIRHGDLVPCALPLHGVLGFVQAVSASARDPAGHRAPVPRAHRDPRTPALFKVAREAEAGAHPCPATEREPR